MLHVLLLVAAGATALEGVMGGAAFKWSGKKFFKAVVSRELVLSGHEIEQWNDEALDDETRVAIFQRGLLRLRLTKDK